MTLVCDEDVGTGIPKALQLVGLSCASAKDIGLLGAPVRSPASFCHKGNPSGAVQAEGVAHPEPGYPLLLPIALYDAVATRSQVMYPGASTGAALPVRAARPDIGGAPMRTIFVKFLTYEDRVCGFYELATRARISSFPGEVYQVPIEALQMLDDQHIGYRRATDSEVKAAHDQVRNPTPAVL